MEITYNLKVTTSDEIGAETDSNVYIYLIGRNGNSGLKNFYIFITCGHSQTKIVVHRLFVRLYTNGKKKLTQC